MGCGGNRGSSKWVAGGGDAGASAVCRCCGLRMRRRQQRKEGSWRSQKVVGAGGEVATHSNAEKRRVDVKTDPSCPAPFLTCLRAHGSQLTLLEKGSDLGCRL